MKPILCNYYITERCNAKCDFCDIWKKNQLRKTADCSLNDVLINLPRIKKLGVRFIDFTGGEPLLHPDLPEMLKAAKQVSLFTSVTTNCLLYPERAPELAGLVDILHFSLDSSIEREHDSLRGRKIFHKVMESIKIAKQLKEKPDLLYTVTNSNYKAIDGLIQLATKEKLILLINPVFSYRGQEKLDNDVLDYLDRYKKLPYVYLNRALHKFMQAGGNNPASPRCRAVTSSIVISPKNQLLLPCYHHFFKAIPLNSNLEQIYKSKVIKYFQRTQGKFSFCENCTINCYFDPSFLYRVDDLFWQSLMSKIKYGFDKFIRIR